MKRYFDLSLSEKMALTEEQFQQSVSIEGIHRGIKPPLTVDALLSQKQFTGFSLPPDTVVFYEISRPQQYSGVEATGICFRTAENARAAMANAICIVDSGYGDARKSTIVTGDMHVRERYVTLSPQKWYSIAFEEFDQDDTDYHKLCDECTSDLSLIRQEHYNNEVRKQKRAQYLELAKGDLEIAKAFWKKTESTEFPNE